MMENNGQSMAEIMKDLYRKSYREAAKVIVAGGRDFTDYEFMKESLGHLFAQEDFCGDSDIKSFREWLMEQIRLPSALPMNLN